jgi:hypothetical protein
MTRASENWRKTADLKNKKIPSIHFGGGAPTVLPAENNDNLYKPIFYISDMRIRDYLKEICDSDPAYRLLGYSGFGGVNYKVAIAD